MHYIRLTITTQNETAETLAETLTELGALSVSTPVLHKKSAVQDGWAIVEFSKTW